MSSTTSAASRRRRSNGSDGTDGLFRLTQRRGEQQASSVRHRRDAPSAARPAAACDPARMPDRLPPPGPSFVRDRPVRLDGSLGDRRDDAPDHDRRRLVARRACGWPMTTASSASRTWRHRAGPRPSRRCCSSGPTVAGNLSGMILEENNRLSVAPRARSLRPTTRRAHGVRRPRSVPRSSGSRCASERCARTNWPGRSPTRSPAPSSRSLDPDAPDYTPRTHARPLRRVHGRAAAPSVRRGRPGQDGCAHVRRRTDRGRRARGRRRGDRRGRRRRAPGPSRRATIEPTPRTPTTTKPRPRPRPVARRSRRHRWRRRAPVGGPNDGCDLPGRRGPDWPPALAARRHRRRRDPARPFGLADRPHHRQHVVPERRLRRRVLGPTERAGRAVPAGAVLALLFLLGNLWIAGRLVPPPDPKRRSRVRGWIEQLMQSRHRGRSARRPVRRRPVRQLGARAVPPAGLAGPRRRRSRSRSPTSPRSPSGSRPRSPCSSRSRLRLGVRSLGDGAALAQPGRRSARPRPSPTRFRPRHRLLPVRAAVPPARPVGRQHAAADRAPRRARALRRRSARAAGSPSSPRSASTSRSSPGLYLLSIAAGYQLDKYELAYSTNGWATGVGYTDANARFFAFDVLTIIAALAAALLVGGAFTQMMWPLGLAVGAWVAASIILSGIYPEFVQRFTVTPNEFAQERQYIANNIAMTRLSFGLDNWETRGYSGDEPLGVEDIAGRGGDVPQRPAVGLPPARRHAGQPPDGAPVLRLRRRRHGPLRDQRRDPPGDAVGARAGPGADRRDELGERAADVHPRHRRCDGAGQRGHARGPAAARGSATCRRCRRPVSRRSPSPGSTSASGRRPT